MVARAQKKVETSNLQNTKCDLNEIKMGMSCNPEI
jgi:hypothetical protein